MKLKIKNDIIQRAIVAEKRYSLFNLNRAEASEAYNNLTNTEKALAILWGYVSSLIEHSELPEINAPLDLTYNTVKNLPRLAGCEFGGCRNKGDSEAECMDVAAKAIASYLYFLAANEHNTKIRVDEYPYTGKWADYFEISTQGTFIKVDFLSDMKGQIVAIEDNILEIYMDNVINSYKTITGINLKEYGVDSARIIFPPRE